ncbi:mechanosensitive ion channel family protein [Emcibacter sp. SYSU 3D8]|uniref:mechanosensitive ion channel family protein n=1 Tax=Emcibacter sp. SYSU 3D8 TaxID=3133969 RepID=UPI0031FEA18F
MKTLKSLALAAVLLIVLPAPGWTQEDVAAPAPQPSPIATTTAASENADIAGRIRSIFAEIDALGAVEVRVSSGVVTLSGMVPSQADVARAEAIAARVSGVVTVQNDLRRDLDLDTNLAPTLDQISQDVRSLFRALPLIGVAIALGLLIGAAGYLLASVGRFWRWITPNPFLAELAATFVRFVSIVVGLIAALEVLGATALLGAVLGGAGVIGIAIGFAVRDTVDNYVSSLMLSLRQPFRANDHVVIEGHEGRVVRLTSRASILMTLDGNHLRIPNSVVFKAVILNYTRNPERRFEFELGIDAEDDPIQGMAVGLEAVKALPFVLGNPPATAIIQKVGDSNIVLRFYGWIDQTQTDFLKGRSLAIQAAKSVLEGAGFALPEPIYRLRFDKGVELPAAATTAPEKTLRPAATPPVTSAAPGDTAPDSHVAQMVSEERAEAGTDDLLDDRRPIE